MTIQTKATEQYFPVVLFIILYKSLVRCSSLLYTFICIEKVSKSSFDMTEAFSSALFLQFPLFSFKDYKACLRG